MDTKKLRQKILDLAIHGKLVPQDPSDEPASVLLERIRAEKERLTAEGKIKRTKKSTTSDTSRYENVPFEIPDGWAWGSIGEIFYHNTGKALNKSDKIQGRLLPYITTSNVYWHRFELSEIKEMYFKDSEIEKCTVMKGDLLVCEGGDIGRAAIWDNDKSICIQNHIHRLRAKGDIDHGFYLYVLMLYKWTNRIEGKGIGLMGLSSKQLDKLEVPIPPYKEQKLIVAGIEKWFAIIDSLEASQNDLETAITKAKSTILNLAIHGKLVPQDSNEESALELLKRINLKAAASCDNRQYEKPFELPDGWCWVTIEDINTFNSKNVNPFDTPENQYELYSVPTYETGEPEFPYGCDVASSKVIVDEGDVLLCKINPHLNRVWIVNKRKPKLATLASSEWIVIRANGLFPDYLVLTMRSPYFRELMLSNVSGVGGSLMRAQPIFVKKYLLPIPPYEEQKRIVNRVTELTRQLDDISASMR